MSQAVSSALWNPVVRIIHVGRGMEGARRGPRQDPAALHIQRCSASMIKPVAISTNRYSVSDWRTQRWPRPGLRRS